MRLTAFAAAFMGAAVIAGCQETSPPPADAPAAEAIAASTDVHPFRIGALQAAALRDGTIDLPNQADMIPWPDPAAVAEALTAAGQADGVVHLSIQPLLVMDGGRVVLIDTGAGGQMGTRNLLMGSLQAAGIEPGAVTDILISHAHGDHLGGLVNADGQLNFPNATIRMSAPEWADLQASAAQAGAEALVAAITPKVETFEPGAQVTPSITAVVLAGHTPGHSGYEIVSGEDRLLYIGDAMHSSIVSVRRPELVNGWDTDAAAGQATRASLLERGVRIYAVHFPFPGLGRFQREGEGYVWAPES